MSHSHPPPPYSTHIRSAEQVLDLSLGVSVCISSYLLAHAASKLLPPAHLTATPPVPNLPPGSHLQEPSSNENDSSETSFISDGVNLQYIHPDVSLGYEARQHFTESRLRKLVPTFIYRPRIITKPLLAGRSRDSKRTSRSYSFKFTSHLPGRIGEHRRVVSELDVSMSSSYDH